MFFGPVDSSLRCLLWGCPGFVGLFGSLSGKISGQQRKSCRSQKSPGGQSPPREQTRELVNPPAQVAENSRKVSTAMLSFWWRLLLPSPVALMSTPSKSAKWPGKPYPGGPTGQSLLLVLSIEEIVDLSVFAVVGFLLFVRAFRLGLRARFFPPFVVNASLMLPGFFSDFCLLVVLLLCVVNGYGAETKWDVCEISHAVVLWCQACDKRW